VKGYIGPNAQGIREGPYTDKVFGKEGIACHPVRGTGNRDKGALCLSLLEGRNPARTGTRPHTASALPPVPTLRTPKNLFLWDKCIDLCGRIGWIEM